MKYKIYEIDGVDVFNGDTLYFVGGSKGDYITIEFIENGLAWEKNRAGCVPVEALRLTSPN